MITLRITTNSLRTDIAAKGLIPGQDIHLEVNGDWFCVQRLGEEYKVTKTEKGEEADE